MKPNRWDNFTYAERLTIQGALKAAAEVYQADAMVHCDNAPRLKDEFLRMVSQCEKLHDEVEI